MGKSDGLLAIMGDDGIFKVYDDTFDITIHCTNQEEQDEVEEILNQKYISKKDLEAAIEEIKTERDKSYACEAIGHGWGLQSALEIIQKHLGEEYEGY